MKNINLFLLVTILFSESIFSPANAGVGNFTKDLAIGTGKVIKTASAVIAADIAGPLIATPRGFVKGAVIGTNNVADALGDERGIPQNITGVFAGGIVGGISGGIISFFRGHYQAIKYGIKEPFSNKSFSIEGKNFLDYEPFEWE